ncbi:protein NODULATION SIGNALING PATHWAY 1 [Juglans regia]|nr:protein NODULATION SIGNALING PATHWAY 1 [Juglans regia]
MSATKNIIMEEPEPNPTPDHILDWIEDSVSFFPSFLNDPYNSDDINGYQWWDESQDLIDSSTVTSLNTTATDTSTAPINPTIFNQPSPPDSSKKRKASDHPLPKPSQNHQNPRKNQSRRTRHADDGDAAVEEVVVVKKSVGNKKGTSKATGSNGNNGNKEGRWAEQLLNPCAAAISVGNMSRVQHLLCVLHELANHTGDANHRLAFHGLRALAQHLSITSTSSSSVGQTFASTDARFFQQSLLKFYEVSPWFAFPNNIANSSILQILAEEPDRSQNLHILDIGVSHGVQWPTLLEALTRRPGGPPPLVRITVIAATVENDQNKESPFSVGPPGDNLSSRLLSFAKFMNVNLQINRLDNHPLKSLSAQVINIAHDETLIVCAQFRLHHLNHKSPDERTEFLRLLRSMEPKGVILSENNMECSCKNCGDFATGFSRRVDYLWRFLDSTSSAFKGRESDDRRLMEGEAAKALTNWGEMNEGKEKWCERMRGVGFVGEMFGEDAIDGARALLRKYDSNWEMRPEEKDGCLGLWWKGQPVSFCSLWKMDMKTNGS